MTRWRRFCMKKIRLSEPFLFFACFLILVLLCVLDLCLGSSLIPVSELFSGAPAARNILIHIRLPRLLAALLCGSALSVSGAILQKVLANPLASPGLMGINAGAGFVIALCGAFFPGLWQLTQPGAFLGALFASLLILVLISRFHSSRLTLVLAGLGLSQILMGLIDLLITFFPDALLAYSDFRIGSLAGVTLSRISQSTPWIVGGLILALLFSRQLELLSLGSSQARALGLNAKAWSLGLLVLSSLLCGAAISLCGLLGFVGLLVPQITSRLPHSSAASWLGLTILCGSILLILADLLCRMLFIPYEIPCGILLSLTGGPFFLWLLFHQKWRKAA